ncbi:MAG: adenylate/guanylate cyclase domain-containing protein, partial [Halieaceae bacterium]|nr:adenylate/guanylate cyclase domain-containing protein [Halieaceae bacterium]
LQILETNEPRISAAVGILTLMAMLWGATQLALMPLLAALRAAPEAADPSSRSTNFRLWASLLDRGVSHEADLAQQVMVRTFNACALLIVVIALCGLVATLRSPGVLPLTVLNFTVFLLAVVAYNLQSGGLLHPARWLLVGTVCLWWGASILLMGKGVGLEYFLAGIVLMPLLLFDREEPRAHRLALLALIATLPLALLVLELLGREPGPSYAAIAPAYYYSNAAFLAGIVVMALYYYNRAADESFRLLEDQKAQADALIKRALPAYIVDKVGSDAPLVADWHSEATVLVATVHGFEGLYQRVSAVQLVEILGQIFGEFDELADHLGVEKVNTLGTNYIAATGIDPEREAQHLAIARLALGMSEIVERLSRAVEHEFSLSAGLSTGDVVSGVIGRSRPSFDIWGRTVEAASAMCERRRGSCVVVNEAAHWRLRRHFDFEALEDDSSRYRLLGERHP